MSQICFIITDTQHKIYYACAHSKQIFDLPLNKLKDTLWFNHVSNEPELAKTLVLYDLQKQGFFNGFVGFAGKEEMYFCDYGKRYDIDGQHIGYEMVLTSTRPDTAEYVKNFYQGIIARVNQDPNAAPEQIYEQEKASVEENVGTEFNEFLLAILEEYED